MYDLFDKNMNAPFLSPIDNLPEPQKSMILSLSFIYKTKGYGHFLAMFFLIKQNNQFIEQNKIQYILYWVRREIVLRSIAMRFVLKLKNKIFQKNQPQNETLLDLSTDTCDVRDPVYVYSKLKYWVFSVNEIKNIMLASLKQSEFSESSPKVPCNVYTNEEFSESQLMSIYMQIGHLKIHPHIHNYAKRYFDMKRFIFYNKAELTNSATKNYLKDMSSDYLQEVSTFFHEPFESLLKRADIPVEMKRGILKRVMNEEPMHDLSDSPMLWFYNIKLNKHKVKKPRKMRRARRPNRNVEFA